MPLRLNLLQTSQLLQSYLVTPKIDLQTKLHLASPICDSGWELITIGHKKKD